MRGTKTSRVAGRPGCVPSRKRVPVSSKKKFVPKAAAEKTELRAETEEERKERFKKVFSAPRQQEGLAAVLSNVPTPVLYGASAALAGAAAFAGYTAGSKAPASVPKPAASVALAAVGAAATGAAAVKAKGARDSGAGVELWNAMVDSDDPTSLDPSTVKAINDKYSVDMSSAQLLEVKQVYSAYLQSMIPAGDVPLRGDEAVKLREFLSALGLPDEEAAQCHIDVGRNFFRSRLEVAGRDAQFEELRAFQKIVYVSGMLFGELRSGFLTPWVARFPGVTPEQVAVAKRDGAKTIMRGRVSGDFGGKIPAEAAALAELRKVQLNLGLADDACAGLVQEFVAKDVDARLKDAVAVMKTRGASVDYAPAVRALDDLLALSAQYKAFAEGDTGKEKSVVPGVGPITTAGTSYATENKNDLLDLYRLYMETKLKESGDALSKDTSARLTALVPLLGLNASRAEDTRLKIVVDAYTRLLRNAVKSGALDASPSPATMLNQMLTQVSMPGEQAAALHEQLYRQKLEDCVRDSKIDDADVAALERTARLLCIPAARVSAMDAEVKGRILRSAIRSAFDVGIDAFGKYERESVLKVKDDLRMDSEAAFKVLEDLGRQEMVKLINTARLKSNKLENARELRNVVYFSNIILAPLVEVIKGKGEEKASKEDAMKELMEVMAKAKAEADAEEAAKKAGDEAESPAEAVEADQPVEAEASAAADDATQDQPEPSTSETLPSSLAKAEKAASERASGETITNAAGKEITMSSQKDITVSSDFDRRELVDIYRTYLMFCLTGDVVQLPMGGTIVVERDEAEFARLSQLGDVLGLTQFDVYEVHSAMAEQAFKSQAEALAVGGTINSETRAKLDDMAKQMGIPDETAQKIMRGITNRHIAGNLSSLKAQGELTLSKILDLQAMDIDVSSVVGPSVLQQLYTQELESQVSSGRGAVDTEDLLHALPGKLGIEIEKAKGIAHTVAKDRARGIMVQAIADYRRNNAAEAVKYLNNFLACWRLSGGDLKGAGKRSSNEEALDVYGMYCAKTESDELKDEMAQALELDANDSRNVREAVAAGTFGKVAAAEHAGAGADTSDSIF